MAAISAVALRLLTWTELQMGMCKCKGKVSYLKLWAFRLIFYDLQLGSSATPQLCNLFRVSEDQNLRRKRVFQIHIVRTKFDEKFSIGSSWKVISWTNFCPLWVSLRAWVCISMVWREIHNKFHQDHLAILDINACRWSTKRQAFDPWTHSLDAYCNNSEK
jgi:hypothetical protein